MRKVETVELSNELKIEIRELTVEQILTFYDDFAGGVNEEDLSKGTMGYLETLFDLSVASEIFKFEDLKRLTPSEIKLIYDKFKEVNKVFFDVSQSLGLTQALEGLIEELRKEFTKGLIASSNEDTETS